MDKPTTPIIVGQIKEAAGRAHIALTEPGKGVKPMVEVLTPDNVNTNRGAIVARVEEADAAVQEVTTKAQAAEKASVQDAERETKKDQKIERLEKADPDLARMSHFGLGLAITGVIVLIGSVFIAAWLPLLAPHFRTGGAFALLAGVALMVLARLMPTIEAAAKIAVWIGAGIAIVWLILLAIRYRRILVNTVQSIEQGKASGQIVFTESAKDAKTSIVTAFQNAETQHFVQSLTKTSPPAPSAAPSLPTTSPAQRSPQGFAAGGHLP